MPAKKTSRKVTNKPAELNKVQKFYIENNCDNMTLEEICSDLSLGNSAVSPYYQKCKEKLQTVPNLMNVSTKHGYAIMNQQASEAGDEARKRNQSKITNQTGHIHKIRPEK